MFLSKKLGIYCLGIGLMLAMASGQIFAATRPLTTDILPSGVPLPFPAPGMQSSSDDWNSTLFADAYGVRIWLNHYGLRFSLQDVEEVWGVASGGLHQGASYNGMSAASLTFDPSRIGGWKYGLFNVSALQIRGRSATSDNVGALNTLSGYDAQRSLRLFELWYGQGFLGNRLDVRVGSLDLDTEFMVSQNASLFLNASFGWPLSASTDLYSGGPSWPYSALGARIRYNPLYPLVLMLAATDDNPTGGPFYPSQDNPTQNLSGTRFGVSNGALFMFEAQLWVDAARRLGLDHAALPGTWKIGGYYDNGSFPDRRYSANGRILAAPDASVSPRYYHGNWMVYGVFDQTIWRIEGDTPRAASVFIRVTGNDGIKNTFSFGAEAGLTVQGIVPHRKDDVLGIAWGAGFFGRRAKQAAEDSLLYSGEMTSGRKSEHHIELTWQTPVLPWLNIQPDFQYICNVGGGASSQSDTPAIPNAAIFGLNVSSTF